VNPNFYVLRLYFSSLHTAEDFEAISGNIDHVYSRKINRFIDYEHLTFQNGRKRCLHSCHGNCISLFRNPSVGSEKCMLIASSYTFSRSLISRMSERWLIEIKNALNILLVTSCKSYLEDIFVRLIFFTSTLHFCCGHMGSTEPTTIFFSELVKFTFSNYVLSFKCSWH